MTTARSNLGVVYYQQDKMQEAENEFAEALKTKPDDAPTLYLLAAVKIQNKEYGEAEDLLNRAKAAQPELAEVYYGLGALYNLQGRKQEAIAAFEKFLDLGTAQDPQSLEEARKQLQQLKGQ
jgi:tetratricopeptide (TPR) repeat protein